jgi:DNA-binding PadR family transcriptional regulator
LGSENLGAFEELVLLAVCGLAQEAYALSIQERLEDKAERRATLGALYRALNRLEKKGYVRSWMGEATPVRGGKRKRLYEATGAGKAAVVAARAAREGLWDGLSLQPALP